MVTVAGLTVGLIAALVGVELLVALSVGTGVGVSTVAAGVVSTNVGGWVEVLVVGNEPRSRPSPLTLAFI